MSLIKKEEPVKGKKLLERDYPNVKNSKDFTISYLKKSISHFIKYWYFKIIILLILVFFLIFDKNYAIICFGLGFLFLIGTLTNSSFIVNSPSTILYSTSIGMKGMKILLIFLSLLLIFLGFVSLFGGF